MQGSNFARQAAAAFAATTAFGPAERAIAYVDNSPRSRLSMPLQHQVALVREQAASLGTSLHSTSYGIRELPHFVSLLQSASFDHYVAIDGQPLELEARISAAASFGAGQITLNLSPSFDWMLTFAVERMIDRAIKLRGRIDPSELDLLLALDEFKIKRLIAPRTERDRADNDRRAPDARTRCACVYVLKNGGSVQNQIYAASINAAALRSRLSAIFYETSSPASRGFTRLIRSVRTGRCEVAIFADGASPELSVQVTLRRLGRSPRSFELVSGLRSAPVLLDALAALVGTFMRRHARPFEEAI